MINKEGLGISGYLKVYSGIPYFVYPKNIYDSFEEKYKKQKIELIYDDHNLITNIGRKTLLEKTICQEDAPAMTVNKMALGDGGYSYSTQTHLQPENSNVALGNRISTISIGSFQAVVQNDLSGAQALVIASTFRSSDISDLSVFNGANVLYYINEAGLFWDASLTEEEDLKLFARVCFGSNFPFDPALDFAVTLNWSIVFR